MAALPRPPGGSWGHPHGAARAHVVVRVAGGASGAQTGTWGGSPCLSLEHCPRPRKGGRSLPHGHWGARKESPSPWKLPVSAFWAGQACTAPESPGPPLLHPPGRGPAPSFWDVGSGVNEEGSPQKGSADGISDTVCACTHSGHVCACAAVRVRLCACVRVCATWLLTPQGPHLPAPPAPCSPALPVWVTPTLVGTRPASRAVTWQ